MNVLVTGGAGFIGSHILEPLIKEGHTPIVVDNLSTGVKENVPESVKLYEMDIISKDIELIFKNENIDCVCHLAAKTLVRDSIKDPISDIKTNILGSVNLLENSVKYKVKKFVFSSTGGALYGDTNVLPTPEEHPTKPISPYGIDKLCTENYLYYYNKIFNLPVTILRYSNVYGPRQDLKGEGGVVGIFIEYLLNNQQPTINGTGEQTRDFVYVEDVALANILALQQLDNKLHIYNISSGLETSINKLYNILNKINFDIQPFYGPAIKGEVMRSCLDNNKARKELKWIPKYSLENGIKKTIKYFKLKQN